MLRLSQRFVDRALFAGEARQLAVLDAIASEGPVSVGLLEKAYKKAIAAGSGDAEVIKEMLGTARAPHRRRQNAALRVVSAQQDEAIDQGRVLRDALEARLSSIVGQDRAKIQLLRSLDGLIAGFDDSPRCVVFIGPPGVGKTECARAFAGALYDDPDAVAQIDCGELSDETKFNKVFGAPKQYVGYKEKMGAEDSPIAPAAIQAKFGGRRPTVDFGKRRAPAIVLLDEIDKIGGGDLKVQEKFWNLWLRAFEEGILHLNNGEEVDLKRAIVIMTSNAGDKTVGGLTGEDAREHYKAETKAAISGPIVSRLRNFVCFDRLTPDQTAEIADRQLGGRILVARDRLRAETDSEITIGVQPEALRFLGEIGWSRELGARPLKGIIRDLVDVAIAEGLRFAKDEEHWEIRMRPGVSMREQREVVGRFRKEAPGVPTEISVQNFPLEFACVRKRPEFFSYDGNLPRSEIAPPLIYSSGLLKGRGFLLYNRGETETKNELVFLKPGPMNDAGPVVCGRDRFLSVRLPKPLEKAGWIQATPISESRLYVTSLDLALSNEDDDERADDADKAPQNVDVEVQAHAFIYDDDIKSADARDKFRPVAPPPLALVGGTMVGVGGGVLVAGGRIFEQSGESFAARSDDDLSDTGNERNGELIENLAYFYDPETDSWDLLESGLKVGRAAMASVVVDGKAWLIGGEEVVNLPHVGTRISKESKAVEIFDPIDKSITEGPDLPTGTAFATAFLDFSGRINVYGGVKFTEDGEDTSAQDLIARIDPKDLREWRTKDALPGVGRMLAVIPRTTGFVVGPFYDEDEPLEPVYAHLR